ncbi:MAG TPA: flagellar basal body P-ring formation chaperone FlgA, partial [Bryobacteraceae bacterium]|nr:flagellar basal body P-ring formation chaperone FlgA [Bryobacteraceae bacterium]
MPGVKRIFSATEIARLATAHHIALENAADEICFERATEPLTLETLLPALRAALAMDDAKIEIVDFSHAGVPHGSLLFSKAGLSASGIWRGRVVFDQTKSMPVWAKARVTVERTWVEASLQISAGKLIDASQLVVRKGPRFPFGPMPVDSMELAAGHQAMRAIAAGEAIFAGMITQPREVEVGETVHVSASSGGALLEFDAVAQSSARRGETVLIRNPENNHLFQARVDAKGKVSVIK